MFFINDDVKMNIQTMPSYPVKTGYSAKRKKSWKKGINFRSGIGFICKMDLMVYFTV